MIISVFGRYSYEIIISSLTTQCSKKQQYIVACDVGNNGIMLDTSNSLFQIIFYSSQKLSPAMEPPTIPVKLDQFTPSWARAVMATWAEKNGLDWDNVNISRVEPRVNAEQVLATVLPTCFSFILLLSQ